MKWFPQQKDLRRLGTVLCPIFQLDLIANKKILEDWISLYSELGVCEALVLAGGVDKPIGDFSDSMQLLSTGLFEKYGFNRLHVAGHPEGNSDIDSIGGTQNVMSALKWKQDYSRDTQADIEITTQFFFEAKPVISWAEKLFGWNKFARKYWNCWTGKITNNDKVCVSLWSWTLH